MEPVAARSSGRQSRLEDSQKTRAKRYPDSEHTKCEPSSRSPQEVERAKTWVLRSDYGQIASAQAMIAFATSQILVSNMQYIMALLTTVVMGAFSFMSAGVPRIAGVMQKQYEYEEAQAALNYFTKVPDVKTLKERVIQWGATPDVTGERKDPYAITEEDLIYLFEEDGAGNANYLTSAGAAQTLTAEEQSEALNLTNFANNTQYKDIYGRAYDPNAIVYGVNGGRDGGYYYHNGEQYTRI